MIYHFDGYAIEATLGTAREFLGVTDELTNDKIDVFIFIWATLSYSGF